ncbi:class E sortase [Streptomyces sp. WI04-05B]|uniref:class E sortase n=1 Tax=Streptomyces TaxID=1883 RepID=UPI0029A25F17|nr:MULTISPECIES: class E sortase [unclassified Streptomyces]MDX2542985.1 class E sortase [Streptomyces sp. WI04-05B]MDX2589437.1 class E sortase [Streptomyces sp. WI04-05A]
MTALRPERESGSAYGDTGDQATSYGQQQPYEAPGAFEAAVDGMADPLSDPLPGQRNDPPPGRAGGRRRRRSHARPYDASAERGASEHRDPGPESEYESRGYAQDWQVGVYEEQVPYAPPAAPPVTPPAAAPSVTPPVAPPSPPTVVLPPIDEETVALRLADLPSDLRPEASRIAGGNAMSAASAAARATGAPEGPSAAGGRAARRKAAKARHGRPEGPQEVSEASDGVTADASAGEAPLSRIAARQAARAQKPGMAVMASRAIGEVFITTGVLMLLFVTYQLWWTNVRAHAQAGSETTSLQEDWASGKGAPGAFEPGQGFAILDIPKLDVVVPIAEGTSKSKVLDRGMVGHYAEGGLTTAMPSAATGNFGLAGHRNTHGEPFRYINRLKKGDAIVVETQDKYYVYKMESILPVTSPSNTSVLNPIPNGSGFTKPGRYITLTTCTPEFTSKYRMIVWGKMVEERPRSKGKPDALVQ